MTLNAFSKLTPGAAVYMCVRGATIGVTAQILGGTVYATYVGQANPGDKLAIFRSDAYDSTPTIWKWLDDTNTATPPASVPNEIAVEFGTVPAGNWDVRLIKAGASTVGVKSPGYPLTAPSYHYGPYDRARFTINGVLYPDDQSKREFNDNLTVNDYCHLFVVPAGMYRFAVQGEIHHLVSGWK